jgi:hypothetical protein
MKKSLREWVSQAMIDCRHASLIVCFWSYNHQRIEQNTLITAPSACPPA